jgi:putative aldouronate transport system permease protein
MFLPIALFYIAFAYIPMAGIVVAFKNFNYTDGLFFSPWNGFENFKYFFSSGKAWLVTQNTLMYNIVFLTFYTVFSILAAILISEMAGKYFKKVAQSFMFLPYFISWVVVAAFIYNFLNYDYGVVNTLLKSLGKQPIDVYSNAGYWYFILPCLYVWKWIGFGSVLYLAAIMGIDQECYEAATIDGASMYQKIWKITLPLLKPTVIILVLLGVGRIMRGEFDMFYNLIGNNGVLMDATDIIDTLVFRCLVGIQDFGMASSAGLYQSVLCFVIIMIVNTIVKKVDPDSALF